MLCALSPNFIQLPHDIIQKSDFVFYTKENPLLSWPEKSCTFWKTINTDKGWIKITTFKPDYGWADLYQRKKLTEIALTFDYDIFYHLIYDSEINEDVIEEIRNNKINKINPCVKGNNSEIEWDTSLQFMVFDRVLMEKILKELTLEEYLSSNGAAEGEVLKWKEKFNIPTEGVKVKDRIFNYKDTDLYNYSQDDNYKFFVNKNEKYGIYEPELQVILYDIKIDGNLILEINNVECEL